MGIPGRIIPGLLADVYFGPLNTLIPAIFATGALFFCWIAIQSTGGLFAFAVIFGLCNASVQGLLLSGLPSLTEDITKTGTRTGMVLTCVSFATLTGGPLFGALVQHNHGRFLHAQLWAGLSVTIGGTLVVAARVSKVGWSLRKRM